MHAKQRRPRIPLPKSWPRQVKSAVLHVISLAHYAIVRARGQAARGGGSQDRFWAENERLRDECALLREEMRIKDLRMTQIPPQNRGRYRPRERMAILELRAARGWAIAHHGIQGPAYVSSCSKFFGPHDRRGRDRTEIPYQ